jgi:hypothetical protein
LKVDNQPINNNFEFQEILRKGGATERLIEVEQTLGENKGSKRLVKLTPEMKTMTNPVAVITYGENNKQSSIVLVPVTQNLHLSDDKNPRNQLMVLSVFPEDSEKTDLLKTGTVFDKIDAKELTVLRSIEDLENAVNQGPQNLTFYWKRANGENGSVVLKNAQIKQGKPLRTCFNRCTVLIRARNCLLQPFRNLYPYCSTNLYYPRPSFRSQFRYQSQPTRFGYLNQ